MPTQVATTIQQKRRAEIVDATITALADVGYVAATFAEIARRAGISKSVVAYHFGDKETLVDAVVNAIYDKGFEVVRPAIDAETTAQGQVEAFIRRSIWFYRNYYSHVVALSRLRLHLSTTGNPNDIAVSRLHRELLDVATIFRDGQAKGEFRDFDAAIMARTLRQALDGVIIELTYHPDADVGHYADELVILFAQATKVRS